jgi:hypothetical protein
MYSECSLAHTADKGVDSRRMARRIDGTMLSTLHCRIITRGPAVLSLTLNKQQ